MSDESAQVTFVGGHAVEQVEAQDSNLETDEREAANAAVRKAIREAGESSAEGAKSERAKDPYKPAGTSAPERGPDGKFLPKDESPAPKAKTSAPEESEEELDLGKASVKQLLKAREKAANIKKTANDEISKAREAFEQERAQFQRQVQQYQQAQADLQRQREAVQSLTKDPARAIRELGLSPEEYILQLAQEGTPEGQAARKQREIDQQLAEIRQWREQQEQQRQQQAYQQQVQAIQQYREQAVKDFTALGTNEEKYPLTASFYKGNEAALVAWGDLAAEEFRKLSQGREGSYEDILDYIEDQLAERANSWYTKRSGQQADQKPKGAAPKSKGMSLSPDGSGERRALSPKSLGDLDGEERLAAAKEAVAIAMAASRQNS